MLFAEPIRVTDRGVVIHPRPYRGAAFEDDPMHTSDVHALVFRWSDEFELAAVDPWPRLLVRWDGGEVVLAPRTFGGLLSPLSFEARAESAVREVERRAPERVRLGWVDVPVVDWERVTGLPALPEDGGASAGDGAYRAGRALAEEVAVAARSGPTPLEAMLDWLASSPDRPWRDHPREVRVTEDALYASRGDGSAWRLPLTALRRRDGVGGEDAVYVFGRRTRLVLTARVPPCPVRAFLDRRLTAGGVAIHGEAGG